MATKKSTAVKSDFTYEDHGNVIMVTPESDEAKTWVEENVQVESWAWMGNAFAVDHHLFEGLRDGIVEAGMSI